MISKYPLSAFFIPILSICIFPKHIPSAYGVGVDEQVAYYLSSIDLHLNEAEENASKLRIVMEGIIDTVRVFGEESLDLEDRKALRYLCRPVCARDERDPAGQRGIISAYRPEIVDRREFEIILSSMDIEILRQWDGVISMYYVLEANSGMDVIDIARNLEEMVYELNTDSPRKSNTGFYANPNIFSSDHAADDRFSCAYIIKNRVGVSFVDPMNSKAILDFSRSENLIILNPQIDFHTIDPNWVTREAVFFIGDNCTVGEVVDRLYDNDKVKYAKPDSWIILD